MNTNIFDITVPTCSAQTSSFMKYPPHARNKIRPNLNTSSDISHPNPRIDEN